MFQPQCECFTRSIGWQDSFIHQGSPFQQQELVRYDPREPIGSHQVLFETELGYSVEILWHQEQEESSTGMAGWGT
jgi:hypothetical protein